MTYGQVAWCLLLFSLTYYVSVKVVVSNVTSSDDKGEVMYLKDMKTSNVYTKKSYNCSFLHDKFFERSLLIWQTAKILIQLVAKKNHLSINCLLDNSYQIIIF